MWTLCDPCFEMNPNSNSIYDWRQTWIRGDMATDAMGSRSTSTSSSIRVTQGGAWVTQVFFWHEFRVQYISGDYSDDDDDNDGKINSSLCLIKNTCGDAFLTRTLDGSAQLSSHDNNPGMPTHCTGAWVGLKVGLDSTTMRILPPSANRTAVFQIVVSHCINCAISGDYSSSRHVI
jgi:hypothetical protein